MKPSAAVTRIAASSESDRPWKNVHDEIERLPHSESRRIPLPAWAVVFPVNIEFATARCSIPSASTPAPRSL